MSRKNGTQNTGDYASAESVADGRRQCLRDLCLWYTGRTAPSDEIEAAIDGRLEAALCSVERWRESSQDLRWLHCWLQLMKYDPPAWEGRRAHLAHASVSSIAFALDQAAAYTAANILELCQSVSRDYEDLVAMGVGLAEPDVSVQSALWLYDRGVVTQSESWSEQLDSNVTAQLKRDLVQLFETLVEGAKVLGMHDVDANRERLRVTLDTIVVRLHELSPLHRIEENHE
jgi:hypothetical protein